MNVDHIFEKEMLVNEPKHGKWLPDMAMLMHVASYDDHGAHPASIAENAKEMTEHGLKPRRVKLQLMVYVEYLDDPITGQPS